VSFNSQEYGEYTGAPITLLKFESEAISSPILYTDIAFPVVFNGETYLPEAIKVGAFTASETLDKASLDLIAPTDSQVPMLFRYYPLGGSVSLTMFYGHDGDPAGEFLAIWSGRVRQVAHQDDAGTATISCEPISTSLQRPGLRRNYQRLCPHVLYGDKCKANKTAHTIVATVVSVRGDKITVQGQLPGAASYKGGMVEWTRRQAGQIPLRDLRMVTDMFVSSSTTEIKAMGAVLGLVAGDQVKLSHGCTHGLDVCTSLFNNAPNYGGMPWIPTDNPMSGGSVY